jgi:hypothetical protein
MNYRGDTNAMMYPKVHTPADDNLHWSGDVGITL